MTLKELKEFFNLINQDDLKVYFGFDDEDIAYNVNTLELAYVDDKPAVVLSSWSNDKEIENIEEVEE